MEITLTAIISSVSVLIGAAGLGFGLWQLKIKNLHEKELERQKGEQVKELERLKSEQVKELEQIKNENNRELDNLRHIKGIEISNLNYQKSLESEYDKDIRATRIKIYQDAWKIIHNSTLGNMNTGSITLENLNKLYNDLFIWFNESGGLFLTMDSHKAYINALGTIHTEKSRMGRLSLPINPDEQFETFKKVLDACKSLGENLVEDINTRKKTFFPDQFQTPNNITPP